MVLTGQEIGNAIRALSRGDGKMKTIYRLKKAKIINTLRPTYDSMMEILKEDGWEEVLKEILTAIKDNISEYSMVYGGILDVPQPKTWTSEIGDLYKSITPFVEKATEISKVEHEFEFPLFKIEELPEEIDSQEEGVLLKLTEFNW